MRPSASWASPASTPPRATDTTSSIVSEPPSISSCSSVRGRTLVIWLPLPLLDLTGPIRRYGCGRLDTTNVQHLPSPAQQMRPLDDIDHKILVLMRENSRRTLADIGGQVSLSVAAVKRRVQRLERDGVIRGYTARIDSSLLGDAIE